MAQDEATSSGPDLTRGVAMGDLTEGKLVGHVGEEEVLLVHADGQLFGLRPIAPIIRVHSQREWS